MRKGVIEYADMDDKNYEKELFEFDKPKRRFPKLYGIFHRADLEGAFAVTLTLEKIILVVIGTMMVLVVVYALGVEKGRVIGAKAVVEAIRARQKTAASPAKRPVVQPFAQPIKQRR